MKINGWLFVDKPEGISSRKVVDLISNSLSIKKNWSCGNFRPNGFRFIAYSNCRGN